MVPRMNTRLLSFLLLLSVGVAAGQQAEARQMDQMSGMDMSRSLPDHSLSLTQTESRNIYLNMMDTMMFAMEHTNEGSTPGDIFMYQMIPHHLGAISMADYEIAHGKNFDMIQLAKSIEAEQRNEVSQMKLWLQQTQPDKPASDLYRQAIDQTMNTMMKAMPGNDQWGDVDQAFAQVMIPHHQAAIDMARVLLQFSQQEPLATYAAQLISAEKVEIDQMSAYVHQHSPYSHDRVYTANQVSNTVSVVDPSTNQFLGEIYLGKPYPNVLSPLYRGESLVHGLRYSKVLKMLAVVSIGSNSVTLISTEDNHILKTIYIGRSPHEPTFTPDNKQIWVSVRGEAYVSVIDVGSMKEVSRVPVADGPGMISFTPDGKLAYVCSSFTPEVDIVQTSDYKIVKRIPVTSPFSPNIFTSPDGKWIAMTHKDVGKVTVINTQTQSVAKVINTGPITNHVTFTMLHDTLWMLVTVGGKNMVRMYDVDRDFVQTDTVMVGALPHGIWPSADGKIVYVGLEYGDQVRGIDMETRQVMPLVKIGQSPQALVYADNAVSDISNRSGLTGLNDTAATQIATLNSLSAGSMAIGRLAIRSIGLADLIEQVFTGLNPSTSYTLLLSRSSVEPFSDDYEINSFTTDAQGKYSGQSTGLIKTTAGADLTPYKHILLRNNETRQTVLMDNPAQLN
jgi:YVTN family beta-propeller protein